MEKYEQENPAAANPAVVQGTVEKDDDVTAGVH
jgi:hypothetical protein